jgi:hypothetical protein
MICFSSDVVSVPTISLSSKGFPVQFNVSTAAFEKYIPKRNLREDSSATILMFTSSQVCVLCSQ